MPRTRNPQFQANPGNRKFSDKQVKLLREAYESKDRPAYMSHTYLAKLHNVSKSAMERLLTYVTYKHV